MKDSLDILFLAPDVPYPLNDGVSQRVYHFLKGLARHHRVTLVALLQSEEKRPHKSVFEAMGIETHFRHVELNPWRTLLRRVFDPIPDTVRHWDVPGLREEVLAFVRKKDYDLIHCEDISMASHLCGQDIRVPVVTDRTRVDLEFQLASRKYVRKVHMRIANVEIRLKTWRFERNLLRQFPHQVVCSDDDRDFLHRTFGVLDSLCIVRNGIDETYFHEMEPPAADAPPTLVFTGAMHYFPNIDAMQWFFSEMHAPLRSAFPDLRMIIAGKNPPAEVQAFAQLPGVEVTGAVPDIRPYYACGDVFITPIRIGGGTRLKIVEAMAMGRPVVSTTIGCQGLDLVHEKHILKADTAAAFIDAVTRMLKDRSSAQSIARDGRDFVLENFTWSKLADELDTFYRRVAADSKR